MRQCVLQVAIDGGAVNRPAFIAVADLRDGGFLDLEPRRLPLGVGRGEQREGEHAGKRNP